MERGTSWHEVHAWWFEVCITLVLNWGYQFSFIHVFWVLFPQCTRYLVDVVSRLVSISHKNAWLPPPLSHMFCFPTRSWSISSGGMCPFLVHFFERVMRIVLKGHFMCLCNFQHFEVREIIMISRHFKVIDAFQFVKCLSLFCKNKMECCIPVPFHEPKMAACQEILLDSIVTM